MNKFPASLRSDFSDCRFASEQVPLCFGIRADFIGILTRIRGDEGACIQKVVKRIVR